MKRALAVGITMLFLVQGLPGVGKGIEKVGNASVRMNKGTGGLEGSGDAGEGVLRDAGRSEGGHYEQDEFGGSWFDDFEDESGVEWKENVINENRKVSPWPYVDWKYRNPIAIKERSSVVLTDYQVPVSLDAINFDYSKARSNGEDIRFTDDNGTSLHYWIERWERFGDSRIWIKVPDIGANEMKRIWMYCGNPDAVSKSDGDNVFEFFDDFRGNSLNPLKWNIDAVKDITETMNNYFRFEDASKDGNNNWIYGNTDKGCQHQARWTPIDDYIVEWRSKISDTAANQMGQGGIALVDSGDRINAYVCHGDGWGTKIEPYIRSTIESVHNIAIVSSNDERDFRYVVNGNSIKTYQKAVSANTYDCTGDEISSDLVILSLAAGAYETRPFLNYIEINGLKVRKYASIEPTIAVGSTKTNPSSYITSSPVSFPEDRDELTLSVSKTEPAITFINVSVINASTNQTIPGYENRTERNINISNITAESIRLKAWFSGDGENTPSLDSWGVEWTAENAWRDSFTGEGKSIGDMHTVGLWHFDERAGRVLKDSSGYGNHGILTNMNENDWTVGRNRGALEFDGTDDFVALDNGPSLDVASGDFTVSAWIQYTSGSGHAKGIIEISSFDTDYILSTGNSNDGQDKIAFGVGNHWYYNAGNNLNNGMWHYITGVKDENSIKIYVDGICTNYINGTINYDGNDRVGCWKEQYFNGKIDDIRISNIARTPDEIRRAYQAGIAIRGGQAQLASEGYDPGAAPSCVGYWSFDEGSGDTAYDGSGKGNDGTLQNMGDEDWVEGVRGGALEFDGDNDYADIISAPEWNFGLNDFTLELWMKLSDNPTNNNGLLTHSTGDAPGGTFDGWTLLIQGASWVAFLGGVPGGSNVEINIVSTSVLDMKWHHIAVTRSNDLFTIFTDSVPTDSASWAGSFNYLPLNLLIGRYQNYFFNGLIDEPTIYNRALTPTEISAYYNFSSARYTTNATLLSEPISLPSNNTWDTFHFNRTVPDSTCLNISVHDTTTNETLATNLSHNSTGEYIDLSHINALEHPSIYLNASFESNGTTTPVLYDWAVNWTPIVEPDFIIPIDDIPVTEDTPQVGILDVSHHFRDRYSNVRPPSYSLMYDDTNITLKLNGTILNAVRLAGNFTGKVAVQVLCTNVYNLTAASNIFNISVTGENDAPLWCSTPPSVVLDEDTTITTEWSLYDHIFDAEDDELEFSILSDNSFISAEALEDGRINISATDDFNGDTTLIVTAGESGGGPLAPGNISIPVTVNPVNDLPTAELVLPANGSILSDTTVTFEWRGFDVDNYLYDLAFQLDLGTSENPAVHTTDITGDRITISGLAEGATYYWRMIPSDSDGNGICLNGTWTFTIGTNATVPTVILGTPLNGSIVNSTDVNLSWDLVNRVEGDTVFHIYVGTHPDNLSDIEKTLDTSATIIGLLDNTTYYWRVIPVIGALVGRCAETWQLTVDTTFRIIHNITVEIDVERLEIVHGRDGMFNVTLTNDGNVPTLVEIDFSGLIAGFINATDRIVIPVDNGTRIPVMVYNTRLITPQNYVLILEIRYAGKLETITIPVNITSSTPSGDDDDTEPTEKPTDKGGLSKWFYLVIAVAIILVLCIVGIVLIMRRKRSKQPDEEIEGIEADIVRPDESLFSQPREQPPVTIEQPVPPQFAPSVKHEYAPKIGRAVPSAFPAPPVPAQEQIPAVSELLGGIDTEMPSVPPPASPPLEQLPQAAVSPGYASVPPPFSPPSAPQPIPSGPQIVGVDTQFSLDDIFLVYVDGRLVKSVSQATQLREEMDQDIMSGMLTAITDFIKDSFKDDAGALKTLQHGKMTIYIERGVGMYLAVVFRGQPPHDLREKMRWLLIRLWEKYKLKLKVWDGSYDGLDGLDTMLNSLLNQTEPRQGGMAVQRPVAGPSDGSGPIVSVATEAMMCNICMGVVKPGLEIITCTCGNRYHNACGNRVGVCPKCGISLLVPPQVSELPDGTMGAKGELPAPGAEVPVPGGLMPPPPEERVDDVPKMLPEYSGQRAGEGNEYRI